MSEAAEDAEKPVGWATAPHEHPRGQNRIGAVAHAEMESNAILPTLQVLHPACLLDETVDEGLRQVDLGVGYSGISGEIKGAVHRSEGRSGPRGGGENAKRG